MLIERITIRIDDKFRYLMYIDGKRQCIFSEADDPQALTKADEWIEAKVEEANHKGITPKVRRE